MSSFCSEFAKSGDCLCNQLISLDDAQSATLLRVISQGCCLAHTVPPESLSSAATVHDAQTWKAVTQIMNSDQLSDLTWKQDTLPV